MSKYADTASGGSQACSQLTCDVLDMVWTLEQTDSGAGTPEAVRVQLQNVRGCLLAVVWRSLPTVTQFRLLCLEIRCQRRPSVHQAVDRKALDARDEAYLVVCTRYTVSHGHTRLPDEPTERERVFACLSGRTRAQKSNFQKECRGCLEKGQSRTQSSIAALGHVLPQVWASKL